MAKQLGTNFQVLQRLHLQENVPVSEHTLVVKDVKHKLNGCLIVFTSV